MEVESFEDEQVAKLLNDWFVSIKVSSNLVPSNNPSLELVGNEYYSQQYAILTHQCFRWIERKGRMLIR